MRNKKGFTLVELLAIIAILAMIMLMTFPAVSDAINRSKKRTYETQIKLIEDSAIGYVSKHVKELFPSDVEVAYLSLADLKANKVIQSKKIINPKTGEAMNGCVKVSKDSYGQYRGKYYEQSCEEIGGSKMYLIGEVVYFDPTGSVSDCASGKEWTPSNTGTTCYKWNVVKDNGNNIEMLLDHNLPTKMAWVTKEDFLAAGGIEENYDAAGTKYGPITVLNQLKVDTASWSNVEMLTSNDNVTRSDGKENYTIDYNGMKARLISAQEVANLDGNTSWQPDGEDVVITSATWLKQNLSLDNTDTYPWGYWTDLGRVRETGAVGWNVFFQDDKSLHKASISAATFIGNRPVVRVLKSNL